MDKTTFFGLTVVFSIAPELVSLLILGVGRPLLLSVRDGVGIPSELVSFLVLGVERQLVLAV